MVRLMKIGHGDIFVELRDILPKNKKMPYDKMRPPKLEGKVIIRSIYIFTIILLLISHFCYRGRDCGTLKIISHILDFVLTILNPSKIFSHSRSLCKICRILLQFLFKNH
jgi:hypothetical protein